MSDLPDLPYMPVENFRETNFRHSSRRVGDYAYRVTLFNGQVLPGELFFGEIDVGSQSPLVPLNITNMGVKPLPIKAVTCVGDFVASTTCPVDGTLAKGESCEVRVQFAPTRSGPCTGGVYIDTGDSMGTEFTKLNGVGSVQNPTISISDAVIVSNALEG